MNKNVIFVCLLTILPAFFPYRSAAQDNRSERLKPTWIKNQPKPSNGTFTYVLQHDWAADVEEARKKCLNDLIVGSGMESGMVVVTDINTTLGNSMVWEDNKLVEKSTDEFVASSTMKGKEHPLAVKNVAEYWERDKYTGQIHLFSLYERSIAGVDPVFDEVRLTNKYGGGALARSIIPGWGQIYKGSTGKGIAFMCGVAATAAGGCVFLSQYNGYYSRYQSERSRDAKVADSYLKLAQNAQVGCYICFGACAALYIYNLIDAAVAPGATRIVPIVTANGGAGIAYTKNF